jgi:UPF0755 protein
MNVSRIFLSLAVLAAAAGAVALILNRPPGNGRGEILFSVQPGETVGHVAAGLEREDLVRSARFFLLLARVSGKDQEIKAGEFMLNAGMSASGILKTLSSGRVVMQRFTVPEGLHLRQVASLLQERGVVDQESFMRACRSTDIIERYGIPFDTVEGFLFPDTYLVAGGLDADQIVEIMVERFFERLEEIKPPPYTDRELQEAVTIASLVEREAVVDEERSLIAAVFYNRLAQNKRLESCATVQYILGKTKERLLHSDLRTPSPYNTYLHVGLPPGPIASPGAASLRAALYPAEVDYLFFVSRGNGTHHFSSTYEEHLRAIRKYNRAGAVGNQVS